LDTGGALFFAGDNFGNNIILRKLMNKHRIPNPCG
jgi:hypothetical protein